MYVYVSHGAHKATRRSYTGYIIFLNRLPILWYRKCQQTACGDEHFLYGIYCVKGMSGSDQTRHTLLQTPMFPDSHGKARTNVF
jgi:hypothetical protein